jgi:GT2 family glycosyltransferase/glycosyltransferase involved in cell wall biosynthesis
MRLMLPGLRSCFDPAFYSNRYPDVQVSGMDPLAHYLLYGAREGRQPHPLFDVSYYLAANPDVAAAGANPLLHFLRFGQKEERRPHPLFDRLERPLERVPFTLPAKSYQVATCKIAGPIDIVIPVYRGLEETRACVESVLHSVSKTPHEIILVNDCSPDPALAAYLRETGLTLLENAENLGFAASVNRGMSLHPDRDVVLLNNDTQTANDWLDRLVEAAYSGPRTGTVTPFSNNASICSYAAAGGAVAELDDIFRTVNAHHRVEIPTAVGFCMYIRRECLRETGEFRPEIFGKGYGEENDFCLRASNKGWSHVLAADVFVYHAGETSFRSEGEPRRVAASATITRLYPEYKRMIARYMRTDAAKPYRIAVSAWRMKHSGRPVILSISHDLGGGVGVYVDELRELLVGRAAMLSLTPGSCGTVTLRNLDPDDDFDVVFDVEQDYAALVELLRSCGVSRIHVQHLAGHTIDVLRLQRDLGVPLDFSAHDYFVICPQVTLSDAQGRYCGEPDAAGCNACLAGRPPWPRLDIARWREKYGPVAAGADRLMAPSQDAAERLRRYFPSAHIVAAAHAGKAPGKVRPLLLTADEPLVIAALGTMTEHKGIRRFRAAALAAKEQGLPLRFVLAGSVDRGGNEPFVVTGRYRNEQLPDLLRQAGAHVVWFPAQWPETFSYTLSAALELGLPVIAPDMGAFPERLAGRSWTWIVPWDEDAVRMVEFFVSVRRDHFLTSIEPHVPAMRRAAAPGDFYPVAYLAGETTCPTKP